MGSRKEAAPVSISTSLRESCAGLPLRIHRPEGAFFLWLWFPGLPIPSAELYRRLKQRGVYVLSGHHFFPGLPEDTPAEAFFADIEKRLYAPEVTYYHVWNDGDYVVTDNHALLHGRTAFTAGSARHLP